MRVCAALACTIVTASIGYAYARDTWVDGWQLWTWMMCVGAVVFALMPAATPRIQRTKACVWVSALALAALLLRVVCIGTVPGGLHVDELGVAGFALSHVFPESRRTANPFRSGPASQPALFHYLIRLSLALVGNSIAGMRVSSAVAGSLGVVATYALVRVLQDRRTALLAALIMTGYHYHIHWSRLGLNNVWDTLWVPGMLACFAWGWKQHWSGGAVLAGLVLGLSQYFYAGSKVGVLLLAYLILWLWAQERDSRRLVVHTGKLLLVAACVAAPLTLFVMRDPASYFTRAHEAFGWRSDVITQFTGGRLDLLGFAWYQAWRSIGAFGAVPDVTGFYGPGVPLTIGLSVMLFTIGLLYSVYRRRFVPALWILLTVVLGGFLMADPPSSSHYVVSIPAICWLSAVPLGWLAERGRGRLVIGILFVVLATDLLFYFGVYVPSGPRDLIYPFPADLVP